VRTGHDPVLSHQRGAGEGRAPSGDGAVDSPRRRTRNARQSIDWASLRGNLSRDPAVRYAESGRAFVRWVDNHVIEAPEGGELIDAVPPHWRKSVAELARSCAGAWLALAEELEDRG
jgi:hypothetical protein